MAELNLKKGFDILLEGESAKQVDDAYVPNSVVLDTSQFRGVKLKPLVEVGDKVKVGTPLVVSKQNPDWVFTSPTSGEVKEVVRGARRVINSILIEPDFNYDQVEYKEYTQRELVRLSREDVMEQLMASGMLALFRERPFDYVANPENTPRDIFVSTLDTAPLAADPNLIVGDNGVHFQAGLDICTTLTDGDVHVCVDGKRKDVAEAFAHARHVKVHRVTGPHPAGCVGVQIHHLAPINGRNDVVWHIGVQGLITIGKLLTTGKISPDIIVAVSGTGADKENRKHLRTVMGADVASLIGDRKENIRYISGNVLTGKKVEAGGHLGFYDNLVTCIPEVTEPEFLGWQKPGLEKQSIYKAFMSHMFPGKRFNQNTCINGGRRAFFATGIYEGVTPMDLYPLYLVKSCLKQDIDEMERLGIYEVTEEEVALCEYVCPSKGKFMSVIRDGLTLIEKEG